MAAQHKMITFITQGIVPNDKDVLTRTEGLNQEEDIVIKELNEKYDALKDHLFAEALMKQVS